MALEAGTKLGPYEILSPLGAAGMVGAKGRTPMRDVQPKITGNVSGVCPECGTKIEAVGSEGE